MDEDKVFQEVDVFTLIRKIGTKNKVLQAKVLQELEKYVEDKDKYAELRKFMLDEINSYTRNVVREIFGDIEFLHFPKKE